MGKMALLIVLGVSVTLGIIGYTLNSNKTMMIERVAGFQKYATARNIGHTGVNMILRSLDKNDTTLLNTMHAGRKAIRVTDVMAGKCSVAIWLPDLSDPDTVHMDLSASFMDSVYGMKIKLRRSPKPFPKVGAAVSLASAGIAFQMNGNPKIYGENYDMDGTRGAAGGDTMGVATKTAADSAVVATYAANITGDPMKITATPPEDPSPYVNEYISAADIVFANGSNNSGVYGSEAAPVIGYANGTVKFGGNGKFYGVLVVNGKVDFVGTFDLYGLVICYGNDIEIEVSTSAGTPQIWGGLIMTGALGSKFTMKGTADFKYSVEALEMAKYIGKMQAYQVIRWYE